MPRLTLADVQASRIPPAIGLCPTDAKFIAYVNEAQQRLLTKGLWWGSYGKYRMAAYDSIITMPPQLSTIESVAVNHVPIPIHDLWYEFLTNGFGTRSRDEVGTAAGSALGGATGVYGIPEANYRGQFSTFRDLTPNTNAKKLIVICDLAADHTAGITMTVQGYDNSGNWIRSLVGGVYVDGEVIALAQTPGTTSTNNFSSITAIQFSAQRSGQCWLYEKDTVTSVTTLTGLYQWFETNPSYGRWLFPSIPSPSSTSTCTPPAAWQQRWTQGQIPTPTAPCYAQLVEVVGKKAFIPVALPTDYLIIECIPALKLMCQSLKKQEDGVSSADVGEAMAFQTLAIKELDDELDTMLGSGRKIGLNIQGSSMADGQGVETFM
jgi:hypothetical protein